MGLELNVSKCEFINASGTSSESMFNDFIKLNSSSSTLLGAPLRVGRAMDDCLKDRCEELSVGISRLKILASHDALTLLKASFSAPRVLHTLRSSPCMGHAALDEFDDLLRSGLGQITNSNLSDLQWLQASLPVKDGGLGYVGFLCWHHPPFWLLLQAPIYFRNTSSPVVILVPIWLDHFTATSGQQLTVVRVQFYPLLQNRNHGIGLMLMQTLLHLPQALQTTIIAPGCSLPLLLTQVIGSMRCPSLAAAFAWTTKPYA